LSGRWFALGIDGVMYALCDCGDIEAAEESAADILPEGVTSFWLADETQALEWAHRIFDDLSFAGRNLTHKENKIG